MKVAALAGKMRRMRNRYLRRPLYFMRRQILPRQGFHLAILAIFAIAVTFTTVRYPDWVPGSAFVVIIVTGGFLLRLMRLTLVYILIIFSLVYIQVYPFLDEAAGDSRPRPLSQGELVVLAATALLMWVVASSREKVGLQGNLGDSLLVDLREGLRQQSELPSLPGGWHVETVLRPAYGESFSGDFVVASTSADGRRLEITLVDVSGKGASAGARALLLSGAFGSLLAALPAQEFLRAANEYLLRQHWLEGFATAVQVDVDFESGTFLVAGAGHPPAAHFHSGSGRWELLRGGGPLLGIIEGAHYPTAVGALAPGDVLLLYTDGLVETPGRDLDAGIDRMLGQAERMVRDGFRAGAERIVESALAGETDDRTLVVIWRY
ncbi:MAG: PP2C family protein-serine/threonine phosphatase [Angustibacter sp.]